MEALDNVTRLVMSVVKLHLGCGKKHIPTWINVDCDPTVFPDVVDDIETLNSFRDGSVDVVYACHVLEHVGRWKWQDVLQTWIRKLKPNGVLRIAVPSFEAAVKWYTATARIHDVMGLVCGGQKSKYDYHYVIFDKNMLECELTRLGMTGVREWDWRTTDHAHIDDYSQAYLPHLDKTSGMHMSLNLEATKL